MTTNSCASLTYGRSPGEGFVNQNPDDPTGPPPVQFIRSAQLVKHFTYDGRGRLIRTLQPRPGSVSGEYAVRSIRYLYDGVRRVQEMTTDHLPDLFTMATWTAAGPNGEPSPASVAAQYATGIDYLTLPLSLELKWVRGQLTAPSPPARQQVTKHLTRQYIWGPGDRGLDELLVQFDGGNGLDGGKAWWPLQDAGLDLIGLCDAGIGSTMLGTVAGTGEGTGARVVGQWTYDAYGRVLTADTPLALCHPKMGHKGLFVERLDESGANTGTSLISNLSNDPPTLVPRATSIVHMRNRWYRADLGRFVSVDPNASGCVLLQQAMMGTGGNPGLSDYELGELYGDGGNLYAYAACNAWSYDDAMGLWIGESISYAKSVGDVSPPNDPFRMVDDFITESAGSVSAFIERILGPAKAFAYLVRTVIAFIPGGDQLAGIGELLTGTATASTFISFIPFGKAAILSGKAVGALAKMSGWSAATKSLYSGAQKMAMTFQKHHLLPVQFKSQFNRAQINNIDEYIVEIPKELHQAIHGAGNTLASAWNDRWGQFFLQNKNPRAADINNHLSTMIEEFGLIYAIKK